VDLHETTAYCVKGKEEDSETWYPERGLREGCPTSPVLFNVFHQAVMRRAEEARKATANENGVCVGVRWRWVPGNFFPGTGLWEKYNSEAISVDLSLSLFADDTTIIGTKEEIEDGVAAIKTTMAQFEEQNNDDKEEALIFGTGEGDEVRMLGSWMGPAQDVKNRIKRAGGLWFKVKRQLKKSKLSKKVQARVFETCIESALLFDCNTRTWYKRDMKRFQSWVDKCYRYMWSNKSGPPLIQMQREHKNMQDIRNILGVKSIRWKIEKRVLERIGHVLRMDNSRQTKAAILGWHEELEHWPKAKGKKRKTVLYWKRVLKDAGIDWTDAGRLAEDRKGWREVVERHMCSMEREERRNANSSPGDNAAGNERTVVRRPELGNTLRCKWPGCTKICKNKGGLAIHQRRMHGAASSKAVFECDRCHGTFKSENTLINHAKSCGGSAANDTEMRRCEKCQRDYSKANIARHRKACTAGEGNGGVRGDVRAQEQARARVYRPKQKPCPDCGRMLAATNMARHQRTCRGR
jgi:hypothetical protein